MWNREKQSLLDARAKSLKEAQDRVEDLTIENKEVKELRKQEVHNNIILVNENRELTATIEKIKKLVTSNTYNNEKIILAKIKEVINDRKINK